MQNITCKTCGFLCKRFIRRNQKLSITHLGLINQCRNGKQIINLAKQNAHLQSEECKKNKTTLYCSLCDKNMNVNTKSFRI